MLLVTSSSSSALNLWVAIPFSCVARLLSFAASSAHQEESPAKEQLEWEDHALMASLKAGNNDAFTHLFNKWKTRLISFFFRSTGDYQLAEDLALKVAMKVFRSASRYQPKARFSTWLFQIARNTLRDHWRHLDPAPTIPEGDAAEMADQWSYRATSSNLDPTRIPQWEDWLMHALQSVPESERTALLLVVQQDMSPAEAAEVMDVTPNHLRVLLHKVRQRLKNLRETSQ